MQGILKLPAGFPLNPATASSLPAFRAWLRAPLDLKQGDEIEVDLPLAGSPAEPAARPRIIRAIGRVIALAVMPDGRLWYQFSAESAAAVERDRETPEPQI